MIYYYDEDKDNANFERENTPISLSSQKPFPPFFIKNITENTSNLKFMYIFAPLF